MHTYPNQRLILPPPLPSLSAMIFGAVYGVAGHSLLLLPNTESKTEHCGTFTYLLLVKVGLLLPCSIVIKRASPDAEDGD